MFETEASQGYLFNYAEKYIGLHTIYVNMSSTDDKYAIELSSTMMAVF